MGNQEPNDMLVINVTYDPPTRTISFADGDYAGSVEDNSTAKIKVNGLGVFTDYDADLVFGIPFYHNGKSFYPQGRLDGNEYVIPNAIISQATDGVLPFDLRLTKGTTVINSRNSLDLKVHVTFRDRIDEAFKPEIYGRSIYWDEYMTYQEGALVIFDDVLYFSLITGNKGNVPTDGNFWQEVVNPTMANHIANKGNPHNVTANQINGVFADNNIPDTVERVGNKVSSFGGRPTDEKYPSEKLVKDALDVHTSNLATINNTKIPALQSDINTRLKQSAINQTIHKDAPSTVMDGTAGYIDINGVNPVTGVTQTYRINLSGATSTVAGLMTAGDVNTLADLGERVGLIEGLRKIVAVTGLPVSPTQAELNNAFESLASRPAESGDIIQDLANNKLWVFTTLWAEYATEVLISKATTEKIGGVLDTSLSAEGNRWYIHVEADGSMTLIGGDSLSTLLDTTVPNLASRISGAEGDINDLDTAVGQRVVANANITGATKTKITYDAKGLVTGGADAGISDITGLTDALDGKFGKSGGTINGSTTVNGGMTASGLIRGKQAEKMGDAVMLGDDGLVPTRFLREDKFTFGVSFDSEIFETDDEGCLSYSMDATGMIPVTNKNNVLDIGSFRFDSNLLLRDCFYATFGTDGKIRHRLNPDDLTESIDGEDMSVEITQYNTMFCIPTLYFKSGDNYAWLSNDSTKGTPFFHTLDDKVYDYYAIGVYEGFVRDGKLMSVAGVYPTASVTRPNFRTYAQANGTNWHLVNWHGRQLIRLLTIFSLKRFNSQDGIGNGFVVGGNTTTNPEGALTGSLNTSGAFAGDTLQSSNPVKALIENPWGSRWEFIDDFVVDTGYTIGDDSFIDIYAGQNSLADDDLIASKDRIATVQVQRVDGSYNTFCTKINTDDVAWGLFDNDAGSATTGLCDRHWVNGSAQRLGVAGGGSNGGSVAGVSALSLASSLSHSGWDVGARLAFHFNG